MKSEEARRSAPLARYRPEGGLVLELRWPVEELEETGLVYDSQEIIFAAFEVGEEAARGVIGGVELGHVAAGEEVAEGGLGAGPAREDMREWRAGFARVAAAAGVKGEHVPDL